MIRIVGSVIQLVINEIMEDPKNLHELLDKLLAIYQKTMADIKIKNDQIERLNSNVNVCSKRINMLIDQIDNNKVVDMEMVFRKFLVELDVDLHKT